MTITHPGNRDYPVFFWSIIIKIIIFYKNSFFSYVLLAVITYVPFLLINEFSQLDFFDLIEFFHGNFLDIIIFLTLPTIYINNKVFPFATIQLFFQKFFASAVLISFVQLGTLLFFMTFFVQISLGALLIGIIPYIFLLFAGFFLIMENSPQLISVRNNLVNSIKLVRKQFFIIFVNYLLVTVLTLLPLCFFSLWYMGNHPDIGPLFSALSQNPESDLVVWRELVNTLQSTIQETGFKWGRVGIHVVFRPIKSLFLSFLFLGIIHKVTPGAISTFLGQGISEDNPSMSESAEKTTTGDHSNHDQ